jgi:hypothetical protein
LSLGYNAGQNNQGTESVALGFLAGQNNQGTQAISIGCQAAKNDQGINAIAIGAQSGEGTQGQTSVAIGYLSGNNYQASQAVAIGAQSGQGTQGQFSVAIGANAGQTNQGTSSIAIGYQAGQGTQGSNSVAIGYQAGQTGQGINSIAIGSSAGINSQGQFSVAIGGNAGQRNQATNSIAIGYLAGQTNQGTSSIAIGGNAGHGTQGAFSVAIGIQSGQTNQGASSVAVGFLAGQNNQAANSVAIGRSCGQGTQGTGGVAVGYYSGQNNQGANCIAIGVNCATNSQGQFSIAIGRQCAQTIQGQTCVAVGYLAAQGTQGANSVAIGVSAGQNRQASNSIAIGANAGQTNQGSNSVAIGYQAGQGTQGSNSVAIGYQAGQTGQGTNSIAIGANAGIGNQLSNSIAIGNQAGYIGQGQYSIAIGFQAGYSGAQAPNSIILNAGGTGINAGTTGFFVNPIREQINPTYSLYYNRTTSEIFYNTTSGITGINAGGTGSIVVADPSNPNQVYYNNALQINANNQQIDLSANLIPTINNNFTLGRTGNTWKDLYVGPGTVYIGNSQLSATGPTGNNNTQNLFTNSSIVPIGDNIYSLGASGAAWKEIYIGSGTLNIQGPTGSTGEASLGSNLSGIAYTKNGFATPFINIGPVINPLAPLGTIGGWQISGTGPTGVGTNPVNFTDLTAQLINTNTIEGGLTGPIYSLIYPNSNYPIGNTLVVDTVYGNNTNAASNPNAIPFKTINGAISSATGVTGTNIIVNAGTYNESITIPDNISITGANPQTTILQQLNVTQPTTLITMGTSCRFENFTLNLSTSANVDLTGCLYPTGTSSGTSITSKLINSIWNITYTGSDANQVVGILSNGTSTAPTTEFRSPNAIQRSTINVTSTSTGITRGIYVTGANQFVVRDIVVDASGTGTNIIGVDVSNVNAYCTVKTSTVYGVTSDVSDTSGNLQIGYTDLINSTANSKPLSVSSISYTTNFGLVATGGGSNSFENHTYNLVPGTQVSSLSQLTTTSVFTIPINEKCVLVSVQLYYSSTITGGAGDSLTLNIYKNGSLSWTVILNSGTTILSTIKSISFSPGDTYYVTLVIVGVGDIPNHTTSTFTAVLGFY